MSNNTLTMEQEQRSKWVDEYNNSLPQKKWYCAEFDEEMTIAIGGIYDSEYMNFVFDNYPSPRILICILGYSKCCGCEKITYCPYTECGGEEGVNMCEDCFN